MKQQMPFKVRFLIQLIRSLHEAGTGAHRLEDAVTHVSGGLDLEVDLFISPTSAIVSIRDSRGNDTTYRVPTQVLRMPPGDVDLGRLCRADEIADEVVAGKMSLQQGYNQLRQLKPAAGKRDKLLQVLGFGLTSAGVSVLFEAGLYDCLVTLMVGLLIGLLSIKLGGLKRIAGNFEALAALLAAVCAWLGAVLIPGVSSQVVTLSGLIVLFPGLPLTTAVTELSTYHLMSGSSRFAGSLMSLMKLGFGVFLGSRLMAFLPWSPQAGVQPSMPIWALWVALPITAYAFAILFQARRSERVTTALAAMFGFLAAKTGTQFLGQDFGTFLAGLAVAALANLYARFRYKPSSIVRVPGIILLVPGSLGYNAVTHFLEKDVTTSLEAVFGTILVLAALVGGLLFGNMLIPPRRSL